MKLTSVREDCMKKLNIAARGPEIVEAVNKLIELLQEEEATALPEPVAIAVTPEYHDQMVTTAGEGPNWSLSVKETHVRNNVSGDRYLLEVAPPEAIAYLKSIGRLES